MKFLDKIKLKKENMIVIALIGILLLVVSIPTGNKTAEETDMVQVKQELTETGKEISKTDDDYVSALENRVEDFLINMEGVGEAQVMITLKASEEFIVEKDIPTIRNSITETDSTGGSRNTNDMQSQEETVYTINENGDKIPYVIQTKEPEIEGITIAAQGGGNPIVQKNISDVIQALFHIEVHKIKVVKMR